MASSEIEAVEELFDLLQLGSAAKRINAAVIVFFVMNLSMTVFRHPLKTSGRLVFCEKVRFNLPALYSDKLKI